MQCGRNSNFFKIQHGGYDLDVVAMGITLVLPMSCFQCLFKQAPGYACMPPCQCMAAQMDPVSWCLAAYHGLKATCALICSRQVISRLQVVTALVAYGTKESASFNLGKLSVSPSALK